MKTITIEGQLRTEPGKKPPANSRSEGKVPGVIYGGAAGSNFFSSCAGF